MEGEDAHEYDFESASVRLYHHFGDGGGGGGGGAGRPPRRRVVVGIDEAGRGPVLGPMVYACAFWELSLNAGDGSREMSQYDDSKQLAEARREELFRLMERDERVGFGIRVHHARELSNKQLCGNGKINLNKISHDSCIDLVRAVMDAGGGGLFEVVEVYVDTVGPPEKYQAILERAFAGKGVEKVVVRSKADSLFKVVSAASIAAKVSRDRILSAWRFDEPCVDASVPRGSGYPSDPTTKAWLQSVFDPIFSFPGITRFSWQTVKTIIEDLGVEFVFAADEAEEDEKAAGKRKRPAAEGVHARATQAPGRTPYFRSRQLVRTNL